MVEYQNIKKLAGILNNKFSKLAFLRRTLVKNDADKKRLSNYYIYYDKSNFFKYLVFGLNMFLFRYRFCIFFFNTNLVKKRGC